MELHIPLQTPVPLILFALFCFVSIGTTGLKAIRDFLIDSIYKKSIIKKKIKKNFAKEEILEMFLSSH